MTSEDSVVDWLRKLEFGDPEAADELWQRYFERLVTLASRRLGKSPRREYDEEDVVVSVFCSLDRCAAAGRLHHITDRDNLWRLLVYMTTQNVIDRVRGRNAQKRGGGKVRGESVFGRGDTRGRPAGFDHFFSEAATPEALASLEEEFQRRLSELPDDVFRAIAIGKMQGESNRQIATRLDISIRSVERKLSLIRGQWQSNLDSVAGDGTGFRYQE